MPKIAIFASGNGSNAENIIQYFKYKKNIIIDIILTNRKDAFVIERAKKYSIDVKIFDKNEFYDSDDIINLLIKRKISNIVLAGFLWLIPNNLIMAFPDRILNIHPALLPKYGGKGMYGMNVHKAVIENKEKESGISIHLVNEKYDEGKIIFQAKCKINENDSSESLAEKVHKLEYEYFPKVIDDWLGK
ncbi:MAG: phosphoribosylglycinamide formyltransferase [Bacteroidales bacterium]|nr:phosphoribosylglycinamide formyltransferase [Bacteroidales bacterium]MBN2756604.1 phosphoribosylglycinamide formyltransferase [Bacteroidales bacterium]